MKERLLDIEDTSAALKVGKGWIYQRIHAGTLPFPVVRVGRYVRFREGDIEQYIEQQLEPAGNGGQR